MGFSQMPAKKILRGVHVTCIAIDSYIFERITVGIDRADQLAREAVNNAAIRINTPPSWAAYKQALWRMGTKMD